MALMMAVFAVFALGAAVLAAVLVLDARKWARQRCRGVTVFMYAAAGCSAAAAIALAWLSAAIFNAIISIF